MSKNSAKVKKALHLTDDFVRIILIVLGFILATLVLSFSILAIVEIQNGNHYLASRYILLIFIVLSLSRLITFFKERTLASFLRFIVLFVINITIGVLALFAKDNPYLFAIVGGLYCLSIVVSRVFKIIQNHTVRNIIFNAILIALFALLGVALFIPYQWPSAADPVLIFCSIVAVTSFVEVFSNATSHFKLKVLFKIVMKTYALEVLLGMATMMVAASLLLSFYEPKMTTFGDAMWYCFAVVTTIGFGDFAATTIVGRVVTVILGMYGIVMVAVITSIIVNFYNETAGKKDTAELKDTIQEERDKTKKK